MGLISFREWLSENYAAPPAQSATNPAAQINLLQQQLNDPNLPATARQAIVTQLNQLRQGTQFNPANAPQQNGQPAYKWINGKPVLSTQV